MKNFVATLGVGDFDHAMDFDAQIWRHFGIAGQPAFAFVNDDGNVTPVSGALGSAGINEHIESALR